MNVIYKVIQERFKHVDNDNRALPSSPSQTVLGALTPRTTSREPIFQKIEMTTTSSRGINVKAPKQIEDIPFRRQDRRILNARKRRIVDRKLIILLNIIGFFILVLGLIVLGLFFVLSQDYKNTKIFVVLGPVLAVGGFVVMMFSIEVCVRLVRSMKRERDPEIDDIDNVHHIKHWVHPELIPFGWGHAENHSSDRSPLNEEKMQLDSPERPGGVTNFDTMDRPELTVVPSSPAATRVNLDESSSGLLLKETI